MIFRATRTNGTQGEKKQKQHSQSEKIQVLFTFPGGTLFRILQQYADFVQLVANLISHCVVFLCTSLFAQVD